MRIRSLPFALLCLLFGTPVLAQTNPCTQPLPAGTIVSATSEIYATLPEHTASVSGVAVVDEYDFGFFLIGVDPQAPGAAPVTKVTLPKSAWVLTTGTTNCYHAKPTELLAIPINADQRGALKARRTTSSPAESGWSAATNPFGRMAAPAVPTGARVTP